MLVIAGSYTPLAWSLLERSQAVTLLWLVWSGAIVGVLFRILWTHAPRWLYVPVYIALGCGALFYLPEFFAANAPAVLICVGGALYIAGAVFYALKKPNFSVQHFGFHELFHAFTVWPLRRTSSPIASSAVPRANPDGPVSGTVRHHPASALQQPAAEPTGQVAHHPAAEEHLRRVPAPRPSPQQRHGRWAGPAAAARLGVLQPHHQARAGGQQQCAVQRRPLGLSGSDDGGLHRACQRGLRRGQQPARRPGRPRCQRRQQGQDVAGHDPVLRGTGEGRVAQQGSGKRGRAAGRGVVEGVQAGRRPWALNTCADSPVASTSIPSALRTSGRRPPGWLPPAGTSGLAR